MSLAFLKVGLLGVATCGIIATATVTPIFAGGGWTEVLLVAKSQNNKVKLYLLEKVDENTDLTNKDRERVYELKAQYNGKEVKEELMLCSPTSDKNKYFLFKLTKDGYSTVQKTMEGKGKNCQFSLYYEQDKDLVDPVSIKFFDELQGSLTQVPKEIFLIDCQLKKLSDVSETATNKNKSSWSITCSKDQYKQPVSEVKIVDQGIFYI